MPSLGADMEAGKLVEWLVQPGDKVHRGDVVAVVETQKGAIEIEIFEEGAVRSLEAKLGEELPVGAPLAVILGEGEGENRAVRRNRRTSNRRPSRSSLLRLRPRLQLPVLRLRPRRRPRLPSHSPWGRPPHLPRRGCVHTSWASISPRSREAARVA